MPAILLTIATLGMAAYGLYSIVSGIAGLFGAATVRIWVGLGLVLFGSLLVLAALLVRVVFPGSLQLALGAMLGLQALALSHTFHVHGDIMVSAQAARAVLAAVLLCAAWAGGRAGPQLDHPRRDEPV